MRHQAGPILARRAVGAFAKALSPDVLRARFSVPIVRVSRPEPSGDRFILIRLHLLAGDMRVEIALALRSANDPNRRTARIVGMFGRDLRITHSRQRRSTRASETTSIFPSCQRCMMICLYSSAKMNCAEPHLKFTTNTRSRPCPSPIPHGYHTVTPYLIVCHAALAIEFYTAAFNALECCDSPRRTEKSRMRRSRLATRV